MEEDVGTNWLGGVGGGEAAIRIYFRGGDLFSIKEKKSNFQFLKCSGYIAPLSSDSQWLSCDEDMLILTLKMRRANPQMINLMSLRLAARWLQDKIAELGPLVLKILSFAFQSTGDIFSASHPFASTAQRRDGSVPLLLVEVVVWIETRAVCLALKLSANLEKTTEKNHRSKVETEGEMAWHCLRFFFLKLNSFFCCCLGDIILPCSPGWHWIHDSPASASWVPGLQVLI